MRILYLSLSYLPSRRASSVQVMKMCAALARRGHEVVLVAKRGAEAGAGDDHGFYRVEPSFAIEKLGRPAFRGGGALYAAGLARAVLARRRWADVVYCRDPVGALVATEARMPVVFEAHDVPAARWLRAAVGRIARAPRARGTVAISEALAGDLVAAGLTRPGAPVVVAHDACDPPAGAVSRRAAGRPPVVGYVGGLYPGRGVETIVAVARALPACRFVVVGGTDADLARWRREALPANLELVGFRPQAELPGCYAGFDLVVAPYAGSGVVGPTGGMDTSRWASPMKIFEYMASGVALVASDLPVLHEVLRDGENALLVAPDDVAAWRGAIERALADDDLRYRLARAARQDLVASYTWDARACRVMTGLGLEPASAS